jgi:TolB-like protein
MICVAICLIALFSTPARAQDDAALEKAIETFNAAEYDQAIDGFAALVGDASTEKAVKKQALQYLGRAYIAKRAYDDVRTTIDRLLDLEPPLYEPDADLEPPDLMELYYEVRRDYTAEDVCPPDNPECDDRYIVPDPGMKTLAVMDFTNTSVDEKERFDPMQQGFASMMINYLQGATDLKVIERERVQWLLDELELQRDEGLVDQSSAVRTGKLLGATAVLFGAFTVHGKQMWLSARLVKVGTGEILLAEQIFGEKDEFFELVEDLSSQVTDAIGVELASADGEAEESRSLDAVLSYSQGLGLIEQEKYQEAYDKFLEALEYDPNYTRARVKAESLKPQLG